MLDYLWQFKKTEKEIARYSSLIQHLIISKNSVLQEGDFFGEISLLIPDTKRTATVIARDATYVYSLKYKDFTKILDMYPNIKEKMEKIAEERLAQTIAETENQSSSDSEPVEDSSKIYPWPDYTTDMEDESVTFEAPTFTVQRPESEMTVNAAFDNVPIFSINVDAPSDESLHENA